MLQEVTSIAALLPVPEGEAQGCFISTNWLDGWVNSDADPDPVDNGVLLCEEHRQLNPLLPPGAVKYISSAAWEQLTVSSWSVEAGRLKQGRPGGAGAVRAFFRHACTVCERPGQSMQVGSCGSSWHVLRQLQRGISKRTHRLIDCCLLLPPCPAVLLRCVPLLPPSLLQPATSGPSPGRPAAVLC